VAHLLAQAGNCPTCEGTSCPCCGINQCGWKRGQSTRQILVHDNCLRLQRKSVMNKDNSSGERTIEDAYSSNFFTNRPNALKAWSRTNLHYGELRHGKTCSFRNVNLLLFVNESKGHIGNYLRGHFRYFEAINSSHQSHQTRHSCVNKRIL